MRKLEILFQKLKEKEAMFFEAGRTRAQEIEEMKRMIKETKK